MAETNYEITSGDRERHVAALKFPYKPSNPKSYKPKIGLLGCGGITETHLTAYRAAGYDVVALCDKVQERAESRRSKFFPNATVYTDSRAVLDRKDIEVVDIATHPEDRVELIELALRSEKHVLSQKPFVTDLNTGERLVSLAEEMGRRLAVNQNGRWSPHFSYMRQAIQAGVIGDVLGAHLAVHWNHDWVAGTPFDKIKHVILYDFAIHWFDILCCFMGDRPALSVFASEMNAKGQASKPALLAQTLVEYDGAQATMVFDGFTRYGTLDNAIITGTKGTIYSTGPDLGRHKVTVTTPLGSSSPSLEGSWFPDGFHGSMGELLCAIEENREPGNSAKNNLKSLALCFAALRSAETSQLQIPGLVRSVTP
ncbi:MAG: Gfo/Idh/MocA family oxidoreductase [Fimbriimonas sp.]|nr:Gfo/Idh/MocA family oxidoreductase [Fimbriimonas sp.]